MRTLLVDQYRDVGGGQTVFIQVLRSLISGGADAAVMMPLGGALERAIRVEFGGGLTCYGIDQPEASYGHKTFADACRLAHYSVSFLKNRNVISGFDVVYVNGSRLFPSFFALSIMADARFIYHVHIDHSLPEKYLIAALLKHPSTRAVLVNSSFILERLRRSLGPLAHGPRLRLVENSLSQRFSGLPFVDRWNCAQLNVVVPGRIVPEKGQDIAVEIAREFPSINFHIVGDSDFGSREFLRTLKSAAPKNVLFHGHVLNLADRITEIGAQVSLVPSRWEEPFGLTAIESMACSCLTLVSGRGGLREISHKTGAWICNSDSDWKQALCKIQEASRCSLSAQARAQHASALEGYSHARFEREIREVFQV